MSGSDQMTIIQTASAIRAQNDAFRKDLRGGRLLLSLGVMEHTGGAFSDLVFAIAAFNVFTDGNDPYGEHDFGSLVYMGQPVFWKIDCYDLDMEFGSPDPSNPDVTTRTLTIMMAWEY
jgi:hypothetical protein